VKTLDILSYNRRFEDCIIYTIIDLFCENGFFRAISGQRQNLTCPR